MKCCASCKWWGRDEPRPENFAPCRYPLPEAVLDFIANGTENGKPVFMKLHDGGRQCQCHARPVIDEGQRRLNDGSYCFHIENGRYCGRADFWAGHGNSEFHEFKEEQD